MSTDPCSWEQGLHERLERAQERATQAGGGLLTYCGALEAELADAESEIAQLHTVLRAHDEHVVTIAPAAAGTYLARCVCGWRGPRGQTHDEAVDAANRHGR